MSDVLSVNNEIDSDVSNENITEPNSLIDDGNGVVDTEFSIMLDNYEAALTQLQATSPISQEMILQLFMLRDALQTALESKESQPVDLLLRLPPLDKQLKSQEDAIAKTLNLSIWRSILQPSQHNWWWFFEAQQVRIKVTAWDRFDWFWNLITVLSLTGFASFASQLMPLVFSGGVSLFESIGLLGPGGLITVVISSMRGGEGQQRLCRMMEGVGIPAKYQSEVTCFLAIVLFSGGYYAQENLPKSYFKSYVTEGEKAYKDGQIREARDSFEQALKIDGQDALEKAKIHTAIGLLDESVGDSDNALKNYRFALDQGDSSVLNNLGRVQINKGKLDAAETLLNMGLQRVDQNNLADQYQLNRNLGWVYLEKKRYDKAEQYLNQAIEFDKQIPKGAFGKGIANCFKAKIYEVQEKPDKAANQWKLCLEFGKPETLHEYEAVVKLNPEVGSKLDTTGIFK